MPGYSRAEKNEIVREFFSGAGPEDLPVCGHCGEEFEIRMEYLKESVLVRVDCPGCANGFSWRPPAATSDWQALHLQYFSERASDDRPIRCPYDDSYVLSTEFSDGSMEFRCPYCNRKGRAQKASS
ncbi:MAG TPA: hypothetical protein VMN76_01600 [Acidobacteriota bacterium]|nr:hypothetical protein [Acidobacteriota bacterium]